MNVKSGYFEFTCNQIKLKAFIYHHKDHGYTLSIILGDEAVGLLNAADVNVSNPNLLWVKTFSDNNDLINVGVVVEYLIQQNYLEVLGEFRHNGGLVYLTRPNFPIEYRVS